jgi:predicted DNA-binding protein (UPF0251 family)
MARPVKTRKVCCKAGNRCFHPIGKNPDKLGKIEMTLDELEAVKLIDLEGKYQEQAAKSMGVSRQTIGNIVEKARYKIASAILHERMLVICGGNVAKKKPL